MKRINDKKLKEIKGGASFWAITGIVVAAITFIAGVLDGYVRPSKCHK